MHDDLLDLSAGELAAAIGARQLSARDAAQAMLTQIETYNPTLNAICTLNEHALAEAEAIDRRLASGEPARPLEG
ncbi:amidase, partial [Candidatus Entotheonella serta]